MSCALSLKRLCMALAVLVWAGLPTFAAETLKGTALIIGQSAYGKLAGLANPERDARAIETLLDQLGFVTTTVLDGNAKKLRRAMDGFIEDAEGADVALVYYSGHAVEAGGVNYLIPTDAGVTSLAAADESLVSLQDVLDRLRRKARITILLLDACRSNPFPPGALLKRSASLPGVPVTIAGLGAGKGVVALGGAVAPDTIGEVVGFAAEPGKVALDGAAGGNSPYAAALLKLLGANDTYDFGQVMTMVTEEVYLATGTHQRPWVNASLRRFLVFGGKAPEASPDEKLLSGARRKLLLSIAATPKDMRLAVESLAKEQALPLDPLYGMLQQLDVDISDGPEKLDAQLRKGAENLKRFLSDNTVIDREDPEMARLAGLADQAESEGAIALALDYRAKASARANDLAQKLDEITRNANSRRLELASTYADEGKTSVLASDYARAAANYAKAYEQAVAVGSEIDAVKYGWEQATALSNLGERTGDRAALHRSIALYEAILPMAAKDKASHTWATTNNSLGVTLQRLGEIEGDVAKLNQAIAAFNEAASGWPRERVPLDWARLHYNLGTVYTLLGARDGNRDNLRKAIAAYEAALSERKRELVPLEWVAAQNDLGWALLSLGRLDRDENILRRAMAAFEAAITEATREQAPLNWASTQINIGNTLQELAKDETGTGNLRRAVAIYEAALTVVPRERASLQWAIIQNNMGNALVTIARRDKQDGPENLARAIVAFEAALTERRRERVPLAWAQTQYNLAKALQEKGETEKDTVYLRRALAAYEAALVEWTREKAPLDWALVQNDLGATFKILSWLQNDQALLVKAIAAYRASLLEATRERVPPRWAMAQSNLGYALLALSEHEDGTENLVEAIAAFEAALTERTRERDPVRWAKTKDRIGLARLNLGKRLQSRQVIEEGWRTMETSWKAYKAMSDHSHDKYFKWRREQFEAALNDLP